MNSLFNKEGGSVDTVARNKNAARKLRTMTSLGTDLAADDMLWDEAREEEERKLLEASLLAPPKMLG